MNTKEISKKIVEELDFALGSIGETEGEKFVEAVLAADRVFVAGAGRSLLMIRGFAMRLMHLGFQAYVVGETVTPAIGEKDLLVIASGSGETGTLTVMANKAKKVGAALAAITIYPESTIGKLADHVVQIKAATTKGERDSVGSFQPGAKMFEQSLLLFCDAAVIQIIQKCHIEEENKKLMARHANLE